MLTPRHLLGRSLWSQLQDLQQEMNSVLSRWGDNGGRWAGAASGFPPVNVWEDGETFHVEAELPGFNLKDLEILVTGGNQLTVKGERKPVEVDKGVWHRQERAFGTFSRTLSLPYGVDADKVDARLENGVLKISLPKQESARPRKIAVKAE